MKFLKHKEFVPFAPEEEGSVRINHLTEDCSGESKSMFVERKHDGSIFSYCHRCGKSGSYNSPFFKTRSARKSCIRSSARGSHSLGKMCDSFGRATTDWSLWPSEVRGWVKGYSISEREVKAHGLAYSSECNALFQPIINRTTIKGWQSRNFDPGISKAYTYMPDKGIPIWDDTSRACSSVVIVEDIISAIKCSRFIPAVSILGVGCKPEVLAYIVKWYRNYTIFLDDDNQQVKRAQRALRNTLGQVGDARIITGVGKDPKECSNEELRELLL